MSDDSVTLTRCAYCDTVIHPKRSTMKFCDNGQKCKTAFNRARTPRQLEGDALLSVRADQQKKDIERAQVAARVAERKRKKGERDALKAKNVRLAIDQQQNIERSNTEIAERFLQQAQTDLTNGILAIKIATQDTQGGL
jgi:hypothetical protein